MKTVDQVKNELLKMFMDEINRQFTLRVEDIQTLMTDGVIFVRVSILSDGSPTAKVMTKKQVSEDPR